MSFVHLHNHSHYSILEGLPKPKDYVKKAVELGMNAVALTDSANLHGCHEFYQACKSEGITPIMGTEIFVQGSLDEKINHKLVLLAKNLQGYQNIIALTSKASLETESGQSKITLQDMKDLKEQQGDLHIVCLSGPSTSELAYYILCGKSEDQILEKIREYQAIFGEDNYFLELLYHEDIPKQKLITETLIDIYKKYHIPVVATQNCFYIDPEDKKTQDVIQALGSGHELENPDRPTLTNGDYSFLSGDDMQLLFGFIPEAISNTQKIADMVDIEIVTGGVLIPTFELPDEHQKIYEEAQEGESEDYKNGYKKLSSDEWYLRYLSFKGLNWRHDYGLDTQTIFDLVQKLDKPSLTKELTKTSPEELKELSLTYYGDKKKTLLDTLDKELQEKIERLEYELVVVHEMGFDAYFLIVADYINWSRANNIPVGPGRGSAAGSLMAFLTGITDIDPLPYQLLFERFLNPARISMPDIDTDFADNGRDRVVEYCRNKYGADRVAQICTFGTFAARAAVKDVGRVFGIPFAEMNQLVKLIPEKPGTKLQQALDESQEFFDAYTDNPKYKEIIDNALKIEGNVRQLGVHACAVIIAPEPMTNFTALQHPPKDSNAIITQYSAYPLEDLGLLKMDFLGLRNLTIIQRAIEIAKKSKNVDIDILKLDMNDQKVFDVFAAGDTTGVFQFESEGMRKYLIDLGPNSFEDLIAMVSLYRPGPLAYIPTYIERKYGREELKYMSDDLIAILEGVGYSDEEIQEEKRKLDEDLGPILDVSNGIAVYQEQLMFIVQYMAGFSLGEADLLRRGVGKKKLDVVEALKKEFIQRGATYKNYKPETSDYIYTEMIMPAANYSFNKSHAACYAYIAYQTAFLKAYYPAEFLTAVMVSDEENMERIVLEVAECESKAISVLPPSVQESRKHFTYIDDNNIRFGLKAIKGIGDGPIDRVIQAREEVGGTFESLEAFIEACGKEVINKKSLEALILSGAMDSFGVRKTMYSSIEDIITYCRRDEKQKTTSQIGLFDNSTEFEDNLVLEKTEEFDFEELLRGEKETIGFSVSGHALDGLKRYCARRGNNVRKLKMTMQELQELDKIEHPEKYEKTIPDLTKKPEKQERKEEIVQAVGVIIDVRKIITKTGKTMMFLKCEGFDYDFEVVIFPKDVDKYKDRLEEDKIIIANGVLGVNFEYGRKSIQSREIKIATISMVREQAQDLGLFDASRRFVNISINNVETLEEASDDSAEVSSEQKETQGESKKSEENFEKKLDEKIDQNRSEKEQKIDILQYIVDIPSHGKKEDLIDLKTFLLGCKTGDIKVSLNLRGQEIDTKISIKDEDVLRDWIQKKWN